MDSLVAKALDSARRKGAHAALLNMPRVAPYKDVRKVSGAVTWSRAFIRAWLQGYDEMRSRHGKKERRSRR
jgi:hypothetical protein